MCHGRCDWSDLRVHPILTAGSAVPQLGMLLGLAIAGLYVVGAPFLPGLFTSDAEVQPSHYDDHSDYDYHL